jgi:nicotinamidase-related amidase
MKSALLVIDVQRVMSEGKYAAFEVDRVIERINALAQRARAAGAPVVFIQHEANDGFMDHGSDGWQLAKELNTLPSDVFMRKKATDSFHKTELQEILERHGIQHLVVCGMQSDFCVDTTTRRALALGYPVTLVSDGHTTLDNDVLSAAQITAHHNATLGNIESFGVRAKLAAAREVRFESEKGSDPFFVRKGI